MNKIRGWDPAYQHVGPPWTRPLVRLAEYAGPISRRAAAATECGHADIDGGNTKLFAPLVKCAPGGSVTSTRRRSTEGLTRPSQRWCFGS